MKQTGKNIRATAPTAHSEGRFSSEHLSRRSRADVNPDSQITKTDFLLGLSQIEDTLTVANFAKPVSDNLHQDIQLLRSEVTQHTTVDPATVFSQLSRIVRGLSTLKEHDAITSEQAEKAAEEWVSRIRDITVQIVESLEQSQTDPYECSWAKWFANQLKFVELREELLSAESERVLAAISMIQEMPDVNPDFFLPTAIQATLQLDIDDPATDKLIEILNTSPRFSLGVLARYRTHLKDDQAQAFDNLLSRIRP